MAGSGFDARVCRDVEPWTAPWPTDESPKGQAWLFYFLPHCRVLCEVLESLEAGQQPWSTGAVTRGPVCPSSCVEWRSQRVSACAAHDAVVLFLYWNANTIEDAEEANLPGPICASVIVIIRFWHFRS